MTKEFIREIKGHKYKYLKYIERVDFEKAIALKNPTEKEVAEAIIEIGGGLIEKKHLEKWIKRFKFEENMGLLKNLFVE